MSEAELHILKSRLQQGMWNKAERGDVLNHRADRLRAKRVCQRRRRRLRDRSG